MPRILIVEDDDSMARALRDGFEYEGYEVVMARDGESGLAHALATPPDVLVLDVMLPKLSGLDVCREIRATGNRMPILMLTARGQEIDKVLGLRIGADDYVTKPFDFEELQARIRAVLRRARLMVVRLRLGKVLVDFNELRAMAGRREIHLTRREFDLLSYLAERQNSVVHRMELLREVWGFPEEPKTRAVDYAIRRLRQKIETDPHTPRYIHTVHGDGYCLTVLDADQ
jgi:two-component system alkaline phosphatase synthesis response regulator PhoP